MWIVSVFVFNLLVFQNKYLSGNVYINAYFDGFTGLLAFIIGRPIYEHCQIRNAFIISLSVALFGMIGIVLFESRAISPYFIDSMGCPPSGYPPESDKDREYHLKKIIPFFTFFAKVGVQFTYSNTSQASYSDPRVFPLSKRTTAIGICNVVARFLCIFAPLIAECDRPIPSIVSLCVIFIAFIVAFTFSTTSQKDKNDFELLQRNDMMNFEQYSAKKEKE